MPYAGSLYPALAKCNRAVLQYATAHLGLYWIRALNPYSRVIGIPF